MNRRTLVLLGWVAAVAPSCAKNTDSGHTDVDPECPREFTAEEFIATHLEPLCEHTVACYGDPNYTVGNCTSLFGSHIRQTSCWNPCEAGQCADWLENVDECMDPPGSFAQVCADMGNCETNR
jgi:hypothetical protein